MNQKYKTSYLFLSLIAGISFLSTGCSKSSNQPAPQQHNVTSNSSVAIPTAPQQQQQSQYQQPQQSTMAVEPNQSQPAVNLNKDQNATPPTPSSGVVAQIAGQWLRIGVASNIVASVDKPSIQKNGATVNVRIKHEYPHADFSVRDNHFNKEYKYKTTVSKVEINCQSKQFRSLKTEYYDTQNNLVFSKLTKDSKPRATGKDNFSSADIQAGLCK